jgi:hypothetical protein
MSINLLGHAWRAATSGGTLEPVRRVHAWGVEAREPSQWNPGPPASRTRLMTKEPKAADPVWPDTQPWCHD